MTSQQRETHLKNAVLDGEDGDVKGAAAEIEDENIALAANLLIQTIGDSRRRSAISQ